MSRSVLEYLKWLEQVLIPDLRDSGLEDTADDLWQCGHIIREQREALKAVLPTLEPYPLILKKVQETLALHVQD